MKIKNLFVASMVLVAMVAQSCKKEEVKSVKNALIIGTWHISTATLSGNGIPTTNAIGTVINPCDADDTYNFEENGSVIIGNGATMCSFINPQIGTKAWSISSDETILTIASIQFTVTSHTNNSIVCYNENPFSSERVTFTFTNN